MLLRQHRPANVVSEMFLDPEMILDPRWTFAAFYTVKLLKVFYAGQISTFVNVILAATFATLFVGPAHRPLSTFCPLWPLVRGSDFNVRRRLRDLVQGHALRGLLRQRRPLHFCLSPWQCQAIFSLRR